MKLCVKDDDAVGLALCDSYCSSRSRLWSIFWGWRDYVGDTYVYRLPKKVVNALNECRETITDSTTYDWEDYVFMGF